MSEHDAERLRSMMLRAIFSQRGNRSGIERTWLSLYRRFWDSCGRVVVRTAWIIDAGEAAPRL